ncbi:MAG: biopolymer transporter ExbD [Pedosphaera sp.]|nr:biopolymer transporter ExbD [Pedosphaera sp.]
MRRFSQRNSLVTLNDINVTPLLDLAFVLLIIFIITTPALEPGLNMKLPVGGDARTRTDPANEATIQGFANGLFSLRGAKPVGEKELENQLIQAYRANSQLLLVLKVEGEKPAQILVTLLDICGRNGLTHFRIATQLPRKK